MQRVPFERWGSLPGGGDGLSATEVAARRARFGPNDILERSEPAWRELARKTAADPMLWFLVATSAVYFGVGQRAEGWVLLASTAPLVAMDAWLEHRVVASTRGLGSRLASRARVIRDGREQDVRAVEVVPGDLVLVGAGETFPADGVVVDAAEAQADESSLTGESLPVRKRPSAPTPAGDHVRVDGAAWAAAGTRLLTGTVRVRVVYTGTETVYGGIVRAARTSRSERTPLQAAVGRLVGVLVALAVVLCVVLFVVRLLQGHGWLDAIVSAATLAVAALPEEFPVAVAVFLGVGVARLARRRAWVRRAVAVEAIGRVTTICTDKTGTLTEGRLRLAHLLPADGVSDPQLLALAAKACRRESGDPLDEALLDAARLDPGRFEAGRVDSGRVDSGRVDSGRVDSGRVDSGRVGRAHVDSGQVDRGDVDSGQVDRGHVDRAHVNRAHVDSGHVHAGHLEAARAADTVAVATFPFTEARRRETRIVREGGALLAVTKGAPETVLARCRGDPAPLLAHAAALASEGHKVVAAASRPVDSPSREPDEGWDAAGLLAFEDPVRDCVFQAIAACRAAGIRVVMVTGDHPGTARAIAGSLGIGDPPRVVEGEALAGLASLDGIDVFARARPEDKLTIVRRLRAGGEVVAVTGDGVNDVPALHAADIGIAMGERGTRSAREAAAIVLADDDFGTIVAAVAEGRQLLRNLRRSFQYLLMIHLPLFATATFLPLLGYPLVYEPAHIVWLEALLHPSAMLAFQDAARPGALGETPPRGAVHLFTRGRLAEIAAVAIALTAVVAWSWSYGLDDTAGVTHARALAMAAMVTGSVTTTALLSGLRTRAARVVTVCGLVGSVVLLYVPALADALHMTPPHPRDWLIVCAASFLAVGVPLSIGRLVRGRRAIAASWGGGVAPPATPPP